MAIRQEPGRHVAGQFCQDHGGGAAITKRLKPEEEDHGKKNRFGNQDSVLGLCDQGEREDGLVLLLVKRVFGRGGGGEEGRGEGEEEGEERDEEREGEERERRGGAEEREEGIEGAEGEEEEEEEGEGGLAAVGVERFGVEG
ncbi:hypothetical protein FF2_023327 [Malus domestica]